MRIKIRNILFYIFFTAAVVTKMHGQLWGRAVQIMDNLIAQGKAKPMIVVMPNGNYNQAGVSFDAPPRKELDQPKSAPRPPQVPGAAPDFRNFPGAGMYEKKSC